MKCIGLYITQLNSSVMIDKDTGKCNLMKICCSDALLLSNICLEVTSNNPRIFKEYLKTGWEPFLTNENLHFSNTVRRRNNKNKMLMLLNALIDKALNFQQNF